ncbi:MAG: hypothetical protein LBS49_14510, partial [Candidatus Accumulibacter sp.]|nr:hypothetical protein [Accumulibacter sp.]
MRAKNVKNGLGAALAACFGIVLGASWPLGLSAADAGGLPGSREALFGDDDPFEEAPKKAASTSGGGSGIKGFLQFEMARTTESPAHWSKMMTRADFSGSGNLGNGIRWKLGARVDYDAVFSFYDDSYPSAVERNQRFNIYLRENYLDIGAGDWDFRLGKQHVVWGEMVGLFFADVVSARDMREFILPEFDLMRIPQWAARAEYFNDDFHAELLWIPVASYDLIGKPGAEFYPWQIHPPGVNIVYRNEDLPQRSLANSNYGIRLSTLKNGWDVSAFAYSSMDASPTFYRDAASIPGTYLYRARHDRIHQYGGTVAKDFGDIVLKGEMVYTRGRQFAVLRALDPNGVVPQNTLDWALGLDFNPTTETRFNVQFYQRRYFSHDPDLIADAREDGYSLLLNHKFTGRLEAQALWISSLNRGDWLFRPRIAWNFERNWRLIAGA